MKLYLLCAALISSAAAITFPHTSIPRQRNVLFSSASDVLSEVNSMRVRQIKQELDEAGINTSDAFEKDELVKRLLEYRICIG